MNAASAVPRPAPVTRPNTFSHSICGCGGQGFRGSAPSLLLADEPTGNLDSRTAVEIIEIFQRLNAKGLTIVLVTHEPDIAQFAKREIVFRDGHIKRDDVVASPQVASEVLKTLPTIED